MEHRYLLALGSNIRHYRHGAPRRVLVAALAALQQAGVAVECASRVFETAPLGPSRRRYANAAAVVHTGLEPPELLELLHAVEDSFGRRRGGRRWRARVLDLDIVLWDAGVWAGQGLTVPHPAYRERDFVLVPAQQIAPAWRDPLGGLTLRHLLARLTRPRPAPR